ncbi:MAG: trypsin-like peptidase domain-containing protein [Dehalococcoidia bacterium]|nr:trypsin-like peptidase domain-containing protein [Dehalococcoidia bacterium]
MKRQSGLWSVVLAAIIGLVGLTGCITVPSAAPAEVSSTTERPAPSEYIDPSWTFPVASSTENDDLPSIADVVRTVRPAVVSVMTEMVGRDLFNQSYTQEAAGSGVIMDDEGYIITNNHVVEGASDIQIELVDGTKYSATIVGTDPLTDLAVIRAETGGLPYASLGSSEDLVVGEWVVAMGNALGEGISATEGIVSRLNVSITVGGNTLRDLIQTTAAVNPGNSGGPLSNMAGEVIGINSVKVADIGVEGMSYAITIDGARPIIQSLVNQGYVTRPWLGVSLYSVDKFTATVNKLSVDEGALVVEVVSGGPADAAGLAKGDVIVEFDGATIKNIDDLLQGIINSEVGNDVPLTYVRGEERLTTSAQLSETPAPWD